MADLQKVTVTNTTAGPKIFNSVVPSLLHPGMETGPLEVSAAELKSMKATGYFKFGADAEAQEPGPLDGNVDELTAHLEGVTDADEVQKLIDAETAGKSRKGALAALEARRDALLA